MYCRTLIVKVARSCDLGLARGRPTGVCRVALFVTEARNLAWVPIWGTLAKALARNSTCLYMMDSVSRYMG